jgi:hypothetical protein
LGDRPFERRFGSRRGVQNVEIGAAQPVVSTFCSVSEQNVDHAARRARISTFCTRGCVKRRDRAWLGAPLDVLRKYGP